MSIERPPEISLVVPFHDEETTCEQFFARTLPVLRSITDAYEIVCVDDGSRDRTAELLAEQYRADRRVKIVRLSRCFGKDRALTAGLDHAAGEAVVPIDADLQDPPEVIPEMVERWREGYDVVLAARGDRTSDSAFRRVTANLFHRVMGRLSDVPIPADVGDFRLLDRRVVDALALLPERTRFMKGLFAWLGFETARVVYTREARAAGESHWRYWQLWNFALDGLFSFSTLPLRVWTYLGLGIATLALIYAVFIVVRTLAVGIDVPGFPTVVVLVSLLSGINLIGLGVIGEYLGRVLTETKQRPHYLVRDRLGFDEHPQPASRGRAPTAPRRKRRVGAA